MVFNNPKPDVVNIDAYAKFCQNTLLYSQDIERKPISDVIQGRLLCNDEKWMLNNPKLDVVNTNASAKFGHNPFIYTQDIERKRGHSSDTIQGP